MTTEVGSTSYSFDVTFDKGIAGLKRIDGAIDSTNKNLKNFDTQATATAKGVNRAFTQNIQNASFQVQDFAVQIASGQSAMVAFTQQLPQLIGGLGLLGAGIATAVAVFGGLYLAFGDAATNAEKLEKAIEGVQAVITVGSGQVANYTEEMERLAGLSETLAKLRLATTIAEQNKAIELSVTGIREAIDDTRGSFDTYTDQVENLLGVQVGTNGYAAAEKAFRAYSSAITGFAASGDVEGLESSLLALSDAGAANTSVGRSLIAQTVDLIQKYREGQIAIEALKSGLEDIKEVTASAESSFNNFTQSLTTQEIALTLGERAAFAYSLSLKGLTSEQYNAALASYDRVKALESEKDAQESLNRELDAYFDAEERRSAQESKKANQFADRIVQRGMSESELFAQELAQLTALREQGLISQQKYDQAIASSVEQRAAKVNSLQESISFVDWESFGNRAAGSLAAGLAGFQDMNDAVRMLGQSLITEALGSLIKYGIKQAAISAGFISSKAAETAAVTAAVSTQAAAATAATAATTTAGVASGAAIAAAMAPAAAASSIATAGAAPAAAAPIALSTTGAIIAAIVGGFALSGARQFGGPVSGGKPYLVGERGPEIVVPSGNANVVSNKDAFRGGDVQVNVYGVPSQLGQPDVKVMNRQIDIRFKEMYSDLAQGKGGISKAMRQGTNIRLDGSR